MTQHAQNYATLLNTGVGTKEMRIPQKNVKESILSDLKVELELFYEDLGYSSAVWNNSLLFFKYASFLVEENSTSIQCVYILETLFQSILIKKMKVSQLYVQYFVTERINITLSSLLLIGLKTQTKRS
ncbi:hypothetical protein F8M41_012836 [Gigaspora margarita]|uniref:Uncharacterized protein n=1 Tax=Gigaspora margarita TaxID=4874 RepID=A0A8H4A0S0_GIGMA|nr:hypothetical protein F8M41_012836 [Gigaspora margarita]